MSSLKEIRETNYWIKIILAVLEKQEKGWMSLKDEAIELQKILGTIFNKSKLKNI